MKIVIINGFPWLMSGKDLFCDLCLNYMASRGIMGGKISTIDFVKRVATQVGWNGLKEAKDCVDNREFECTKEQYLIIKALLISAGAYDFYIKD